MVSCTTVSEWRALYTFAYLVTLEMNYIDRQYRRDLAVSPPLPCPPLHEPGTSLPRESTAHPLSEPYSKSCSASYRKGRFRLETPQRVWVIPEKPI